MAGRHISKRLEWKKTKQRKKRRFDLLNEHNKYLVCLVGLTGSDGKRNHAVAVADNMIFDANHERAIPFTRENLEHCCSTVSSRCEFKRVGDGLLFKKIDKS